LRPGANPQGWLCRTEHASSGQLPERVEAEIDQTPLTHDDFGIGGHPVTQRIPVARHLVVISFECNPSFVDGLLVLCGGFRRWRDVLQGAVDQPISLIRKSIELQLD
jgi:hypothetical protein